MSILSSIPTVPLLIAALVLLALLLLASRLLDLRPWPFYAKRLMSIPERGLYHSLVQALPDHIVLAQVQCSRVLGVKKGFKFHDWNNRVSQKSYDFVICAKDSSVVAVIELDDRSHAAPRRADADRTKDRATAAAGIPLLRWNVNAIPDRAAIQAAIAQGPSPAPGAVGAPGKTAGAVSR